MRDLHQIIDLHTLLDPGPAEPCAINSCVPADLDVVVDLDNAELLNFFLSAIDHFETETIGTDYHAAVNNYP
jgi:hypothetical protein